VNPIAITGLGGAWYAVADVALGSAYSMGAPISPVARDPAKERCSDKSRLCCAPERRG